MENSKLIPIAILIGAVLIGGAVFLNGRSSGSGDVAHGGPGTQPSAPLGQLKPVTEEDHILGNPDAPILIVEHSDLECPACKAFHPIMHRVVEEFGKDGDVAWVYRHFPLQRLHPKAVREAEASECAAELGGNDAFWSYIDAIFEETPSNNGLSFSRLPEIAEEIGLDREAFEECDASDRHVAAVNQSVQDAINAGANSTPYNFIVIRATGETIPAPGVLDYGALTADLELLLETYGDVPVEDESDVHSEDAMMEDENNLES